MLYKTTVDFDVHTTSVYLLNDAAP